MFNGSGILSKYSFNEYHFLHQFLASAKRNDFRKKECTPLLEIWNSQITHTVFFFGLTIGPLYHLKTESSGNVNCFIPWFSKEAFSKEANVFEKLRFTLIEGVLLKVFLLRKKLLYLRGSGFRLISKLYYSKLFVRNRTWRYIDINIGPRRAFTVKKLSLFSIFKNLLGVLIFFGITSYFS